MYYLYKLVNIVNGKVYIGMSLNPQKRWNDERITAFNIKSSEYNSPLSRAIRKYGWENFHREIIACAKSKKDILKSEIECIEQYKSNIKKYGNEFGYNMHQGGNLPPDQTGKKWKLKHEFTQEHREKLSNSAKGRVPANKGKFKLDAIGIDKLSSLLMNNSITQVAKQLNIPTVSLWRFAKAHNITVNNGKYERQQPKREII